jgi:hypothetical protein
MIGIAYLYQKGKIDKEYINKLMNPESIDFS